MLDVLSPNRAWVGLQGFLDSGGPVLVVILGLTFALWALIMERALYYAFAHKAVMQSLVREWEARSDHRSWYAHAIRDRLISQLKMRTEQNVNFIKTAVALAPLFGLLGTVTGMLVVFDAMAVVGSSDARAMSSGIERATIPTMAGMVVALSGLFFSYQFERMSRRETSRLADRLEIEH